jgi:hypothetical protein
MRGQAAVLAFVLVGASAACSIVTDTDGLTSAFRETDASSSADGGDGGPTVKPDGATTDGSLEDAGATDAPLTDGFVQPDAGCTNGPLAVCDDFERIAVQGPWGGKTVVGGGALDLVVEGTRKFLRATSPGSSGTTDVDAELYTDFAGSASAAYYDFDFRYSSLPGTATDEVEVQTLYFHKAGGGYSEVFLALRPTSIVVYEHEGANANTTPITISPGVWHRIAFEVHIGGALLVKVDGSTALSKPLSSFVNAGPVSVSAGIVYGTRPPTALTIDVDNVVFHATP